MERDLTLFKRRTRQPLFLMLSIIHLWSFRLVAISCCLARISAGVLVQDFPSFLSSSWRIALHSPYLDIEVKYHPSSSAQFQLEIVQCCWVLLGRFSTIPSLACFSEEGASISLGDQKRWFPNLFHHIWHQANHLPSYAVQSLSQTTLFLESICYEGFADSWRGKSQVKELVFHFRFPIGGVSPPINFLQSKVGG